MRPSNTPALHWLQTEILRGTQKIHDISNGFVSYKHVVVS